MFTKSSPATQTLDEPARQGTIAPAQTSLAHDHRELPLSTDTSHGIAAGADMPLLDEVLRPITRKKSIRALARFDCGDPILCRTDLLRAAKAAVGLSNQQIADLIDSNRTTVAACLSAEPSVNLYTFCAVVQVLGLDMAELFPVRERKVVNAEPTRWPRGPYLKENMRQMLNEIEAKELRKK